MAEKKAAARARINALKAAAKRKIARQPSTKTKAAVKKKVIEGKAHSNPGMTGKKRGRPPKKQVEVQASDQTKASKKFNSRPVLPRHE